MRASGASTITLETGQTAASLDNYNSTMVAAEGAYETYCIKSGGEFPLPVAKGVAAMLLAIVCRR